MARPVLIILLVTAALLTLAAGQKPDLKATLWELHEGVKTVATALGVLMIAHSGLRWIMADGPQERDDAKKTLVYIMIGLLVVALSLTIVSAVYCSTLSTTRYGEGVC